jgi:hypothetical protein
VESSVRLKLLAEEKLDPSLVRLKLLLERRMAGSLVRMDLSHAEEKNSTVWLTKVSSATNK